MHRIAFVCALMGLSLFATAAEARRGFGIANYGDEIFDLGAVSPSRPDMRIGKLCQHIGLFWADIVTWNCRLVLTNEDLSRYGEIPAEIKPTVDIVFAGAEPKRGWWNQYGAFALLGLVVFGIIRRAVRLSQSPSTPTVGPSLSASAPSAAPAFQGMRAGAAGRARTDFGRRGA